MKKKRYITDKQLEIWFKNHLRKLSGQEFISNYAYQTIALKSILRRVLNDATMFQQYGEEMEKI